MGTLGGAKDAITNAIGGATSAVEPQAAPAAPLAIDTSTYSSPHQWTPAVGTSKQLIVYHITTSDDFTSTAQHFSDPGSAASAHYVIDKDGSVYQFVPPDQSAFAQGQTQGMAGINPDKTLLQTLASQGNLNDYSIGIEFVAAQGTPLTPEQIAAGESLTQQLATDYGIPLDDQHLVSHADIAGVNDRSADDRSFDTGGDFAPTMLSSGVQEPVAQPIAQGAAIAETPETWRPLVETAAANEGVPASILSALLLQESNYDPNAVNDTSGAAGIAQFMPETARGLGIDPFNPQQAIPAAARYLKQQYDTFGSWELALAAYNAGPGNVQQYGGIPPFPETQHYVTTIMAAAA
jgi:N-acetyl-anhydromuramyl-L-alanine amidase AmpD